MVLPIAIYNSEVWGTNFLPQNANNNEFLNISNFSKHIVEKLHYKFLKLVVGVSQKSTNWAIMSETGRYPVLIKVLMAMIKYFFHLTGSPSNIVSAALYTNIRLYMEEHNS